MTGERPTGSAPVASFGPGGGGPRAVQALRRFRQPRERPAPGELCEMCGEGIPEEHGHVVNVETRKLLCTCRACYLLFTHEGAAQGKYRAVPDRYRYRPAMALSQAQWEALQIPVDLAFLFLNSSLSRLVAFYPGPGGATESLLDVGTWEEVLRANPDVGDLAPDVEALLVRKVGDRFEGYLVPIDACYELVGRVRRSWKGFGGGEQVWVELEEFFRELRRRSGAEDGEGDPRA
ncbi:MAG TPA: DUF5947 family protein [Actinomycetota bacterium]|nr:DUF5947 family protein [Actinomycetota bacterium]